MVLVCSTDNNYVCHCSVMLYSFFVHNGGERHEVHLLTEGLTVENLRFLERLASGFGAAFFCHVIDPERIASCPIREGDHLTVATYYRLLMADILPARLDKVLYLDCDIVINASIEPLWDVALEGYALAAVEERGCSQPDVYERLGYEERYGYFNAGVLLVNLKYWRHHALTQQFLAYVAQHHNLLKAHDQDVLNALLHDKCLHLSWQWNVEEAFYHYAVMKRWRWRSNSEVRQILCHPKILHYTWKPKPWESRCKHPFRVNYYLRAHSLKRGHPLALLAPRMLRAFADRALFRLFLALGISGHRFYRL